MLKKLTVLLLIISITLSSGTVVYAESIDISTDSSATRWNSVFQSVMASWKNECTIATIKTLSDFAGNSYTLAECYPTGYMIFNNKSALMMESAENSPSPYWGTANNLYYAGPTHYYVYNEDFNQYTHLISDTVLTAEEISEKATVCSNAQTEMNKIADTALKNYIENGKISNTSIRPLVNNDYTYVGGHEDFFKNLTTHELMGYYETSNGDGCCAYVAAGIVLLYYDYFYNDKFIDNEIYLNNDGSAFVGEDFAKHLYIDIGKEKLNYGNALNATETAKVMQKYLSDERGITMTYWSANMPSKASIIAKLKLNRPVIYVDRWNKPSSDGTTDHAIVVYGYDSSNNMVAHFGWTDYTHVECSSPALALFISSASSIASYSLD